MLRYLKHASWFLAVVLLLGVAAATAQQNPKRLVLKDGSYQLTTKWEITGDRVRYFSAERFTWEEMPKDLVDWPATEKYNQEHENQRTISAAEVVQQEQAAKQAEEAASPTIAPGLKLPDGGGVFMMDVYQGQPQLIEVVQNGGEINKQKGKNILRATLNPLALSSKQTIEIQGQHARVQAHHFQPDIYVNVDSEDKASAPGDKASAPAGAGDRYRIVRLDPKKDSRVVGNLSIAVYGKVTQKENWIATNSSKVGDWIKVTPTQALPAGEYALVEMLEQKQINIYVWDFGVNPDAPVNPKAWVPKQPAQTHTGTNESPVLGKRPN